MPTKKKTTRRRPAAKNAKFRKLALRPGKYVINGETREFTEDDLKEMVDNATKLMGKGNKLPVPFAHVDDKGIMPNPCR